MLDWLVAALKLKVILWWIVAYIVMNLIEFFVMKLIFSWMFGPKEEKEA